MCETSEPIETREPSETSEPSKSRKSEKLAKIVNVVGNKSHIFMSSHLCSWVKLDNGDLVTMCSKSTRWLVHLNRLSPYKEG